MADKDVYNEHVYNERVYNALKKLEKAVEEKSLPSSDIIENIANALATGESELFEETLFLYATIRCASVDLPRYIHPSLSEMGILCYSYNEVEAGFYKLIYRFNVNQDLPKLRNVLKTIENNKSKSSDLNSETALRP